METSSQPEKERALLKKYLADDCTPEEKQWVEDWYQSFDHAPLPGRLQEKRSLNRSKSTLLDQINIKPVRTTRLYHLTVYLKIAAMLAIIGSVSMFVYFSTGSIINKDIEYQARNGTHRVIRLEDGSVVTLNSGSSVKIHSDFNKTNRTVSLSGEAYFEVARDPFRPFIVSTGVVKTRVLGTKFNVQAYKNEDNLTVTVAEGKVRVDKDNGKNKQANVSPGILPGRQLIYHKASQTARVIPADAEHISAWRKGILYFDNESIPVIARKLERRFNISIDVTGAVKPDCRYTFRINDETLGKTLQVLTSVSGIIWNFKQPNHLTINTITCK